MTKGNIFGDNDYGYPPPSGPTGPTEQENEQEALYKFLVTLPELNHPYLYINFDNSDVKRCILEHDDLYVKYSNYVSVIDFLTNRAERAGIDPAIFKKYIGGY